MDEVQVSVQSFGDFGGGIALNQMRPYLGNDGLTYISVYAGNDENGKPKFKPQLAQPGMATNAASLRRDEWLFFDTAVQEIYQRPLTGVQDLVNAGLTLDFDGYASTVLGYEDISDIGSASMDMDGETQGANDSVSYDTKYLPLPIIHKDFSINDRFLQMRRKLGQPLDDTLVSGSALKINEYRENMLFNGASSFTFGGGTIYGYLDWTSSVSVSLSGSAWSALNTSTAMTAAAIIVDVQAMLAAMTTNRRYGPFMLYVPSSWEKALSSDYSTSYQKTVRQRILDLDPRIQAVKSTPFITADKAVMVNMAKDTVRLVRGMALTTVQWQVRQMGRHNFKLVMIEVPQLRTDQDGRSGVVVLS